LVKVPKEALLSKIVWREAEMSDFVQPQPASISPPIGEAIERNEDACAPRPLADRPFPQWLANPWVDKILAILAVLPFVYPIAMHFMHQIRVGEILYLAQVLLLIGTMVFRRLPVRITTNLYYWVIAFVASYWGLLILSVEQPGRPLITSWILLLFYPLSLFMDIWGRLSLGRNIGMLPAQRQIVDRGAYRLVRHPIYTAVFFMIIARMLASYSLLNFLLYSLAVFWILARSLAEEEFLRKDPAYSAYMRRVRWRWFPGLI
jgi:protein-S-isoprenylcysteine O-methyltransferase Ste14